MSIYIRRRIFSDNQRWDGAEGMAGRRFFPGPKGGVSISVGRKHTNTHTPKLCTEPFYASATIDALNTRHRLHSMFRVLPIYRVPPWTLSPLVYSIEILKSQRGAQKQKTVRRVVQRHGVGGLSA